MEETDYKPLMKPSLREYTDAEIMDILAHNEVVSAQQLTYINSEAMRRIFKPHV